MAVALDSNKTKIARRVIEVFEFFAGGNERATVMDIVRRYGRPQSSTSELLSSLVEMGLLYKDAQTRSYAPTPRLAALGLAAQPEPVGSGRLFAFMDRLAQSSRHCVALFGMVGTSAQVFRWSPGAEPIGGRAGEAAPGCGSRVLLSQSAAGLLLMSTLGSAQAGRMLWRLNAEANEGERVDLNTANQSVARMAQAGHATGESGLMCGSLVTAVLVPDAVAERALALGVVYPAAAAVDPEALVSTLRHGIEQCLDPAAESAGQGPFLRGLAV